MAKKQSFADKASKRKHIVNCPICESPINFVKFVKAERTPGGWRFKTRNVGVCKCNHSEVYG